MRHYFLLFTSSLPLTSDANSNLVNTQCQTPAPHVWLTPLTLAGPVSPIFHLQLQEWRPHSCILAIPVSLGRGKLRLPQTQAVRDEWAARSWFYRATGGTSFPEATTGSCSLAPVLCSQQIQPQACFIPLTKQIWCYQTWTEQVHRCGILSLQALVRWVQAIRQTWMRFDARCCSAKCN